MKTDKLLVMKKDGVSYIEISWTNRTLLVNGTQPTPCPGNQSWVMVDGDVVSIKRQLPCGNKLVGFKVKEEFAGVVEIPLQVGPDSFTWDHDECEWVGEHAALYQPVYEDLPPAYEIVEFEVIDHDCEPVDMPAYVVVEFPGNLKYHRAVQHKYPCRVRMQDVFRLVADAVVAETHKHPRLYQLHDCRNIQVLGVKVVLATAPRQVKRDVSAWGSRRPKWRTATETTTTKEVLSIVGKYRDKGHSEQITEVCGENYADLQAKLDAYIQYFVDRIDPNCWAVCPHCDGEGLVLSEGKQ